MYDGRQQWRHQSESTMAWEEEEETETLREFECVGAGTVQCAVCHTHNPPKLRELISYWLTRPASHYCGDFAWCAALPSSLK